MNAPMFEQLQISSVASDDRPRATRKQDDWITNVLTVFPVTIGEGERALWVQHRVDLVPVHRDELIVGCVLHLLQIDKLIDENKNGKNLILFTKIKLEFCLLSISEG